VICHAKKPCPECPWRRDVPVGKFPPARFTLLAPTAYDMARRVFACHMSAEGSEFACAGFIARCPHNLTLRLSHIYPSSVNVEGVPLFDNYRQMAIANGVSPKAAALTRCRDDH
jgi:hypothetical protein